MLRLIPEAEHSKLVIVLQNGTELCVDTHRSVRAIVPVLRGRMAGQMDEARGFFVPYDQMLCLRLDRVMKVEELEGSSARRTSRSTHRTPVIQPRPIPRAPTDPAGLRLCSNDQADPGHRAVPDQLSTASATVSAFERLRCIR